MDSGLAVAGHFGPDPLAAIRNDGYAATAISSGNLSTTSWPLSVTMKVWPRKIPNIPSAVIGLGSAMITMPGLSTFLEFFRGDVFGDHMRFVGDQIDAVHLGRT